MWYYNDIFKETYFSLYKLSNYGIDTVGNLIWSTLPPGCKIIIFFFLNHSASAALRRIFFYFLWLSIFNMFSNINVSPLSNSKYYLYKPQKYINLFYWLEYKTSTPIFGQGIFVCFFLSDSHPLSILGCGRVS